jgi:TolB-like protein
MKLKANTGRAYKISAGWMIFFILLALVGLLQSGCSLSDSPEKTWAAAARAALPHAALQQPASGALLLTANTAAADALASQLLARAGSASGILSANLVELNELDKSSLFGQTCTEQISSRLSQHGFKVLDSRLGAELRMEKHQGEFMLTRDSARLLNANPEAHAVLLGVYSETGRRVFLSVRVVRLDDNAVIAAYEYYLPKDDDIMSLLGSNGNRAGWNWSGYAAREQAFSGGE